MAEREEQPLKGRQWVTHVEDVLLPVKLSHLKSLQVIFPAGHDEVVRRRYPLHVPAILEVQGMPIRALGPRGLCRVHVKRARNLQILLEMEEVVHVAHALHRILLGKEGAHLDGLQGADVRYPATTDLLPYHPVLALLLVLRVGPVVVQNESAPLLLPQLPYQVAVWAVGGKKGSELVSELGKERVGWGEGEVPVADRQYW